MISPSGSRTHCLALQNQYVDYVTLGFFPDRLIQHARHDRATHLVDRLHRCIDQMDALGLRRLLAQDKQGHEC